MTAKGMDMGDVLKGEAAEKVITITNTGQSSHTTLSSAVICFVCSLGKLQTVSSPPQCSILLRCMTVVCLASIAVLRLALTLTQHLLRTSADPHRPCKGQGKGQWFL